MISSNKEIKLAVLDLNNGQTNRGRPAIEKLALELGYNGVDIFDVRKKELPDPKRYARFVSTGGPGDPRDWGQNTNNPNDNWGKGYFEFLDTIDTHNEENPDDLKYGFFICHSFQLTSKHYGLGELTPRENGKLAGIQQHIISPYAHLLPNINLGEEGSLIDVFENRDYQVKPVYCTDGAGKFFPLTFDKSGALTGYGNWDGTRIGFQFHPEATAVDTEKMLIDTVDERNLAAQKYISEAHGEKALDQMRPRAKYLDTANDMLANWMRQGIAQHRNKKLRIA